MYPLTVVYPNRVIKAYVAQLQAQPNMTDQWMMQLLHPYYHVTSFQGAGYNNVQAPYSDKSLGAETNLLQGS